MAECMTFPDTVDEYMESYKVVDTDHVYSNGIEFVPIFRMKQWFNHKPERKKGEWIGVTPFVDTLQCSECGYNIIDEEFKTPYCPNCGADMRGTP